MKPFLSTLALLAIPLSFAGWWTTHGVRLLADGVSVESIRAVHPGMTEDEVVTVLGPPTDRGPADHPDLTTLTYSRPAYFAKWYPMLWVHLRDGKVDHVYAKRYVDWGTDDLAVYISADHRWESELFEPTFR